MRSILVNIEKNHIDDQGSPEVFDKRCTRRYSRMKNPIQKKRLLMGRLALQKIISETKEQEKLSESIGYESYGKPVFISEKLKDYNFNLSHSGCYTLAALHKGGSIGVDIQKIIPRKYDAILEQMTDFEIEQIEVHKRPLFKAFQLWTLKESYFKATGEGLTVPLKNYEFSSDTYRGIRIKCFGKKHPEENWRFKSIFVKNYVLSYSISSKRPIHWNLTYENLQN